jgi:AcrR family transcriptional regulator
MDKAKKHLACTEDNSLGRRPMAKNRQMRKKPLQMRSQAMVDAIVEAAARVFDASGFNGASTNRIAEIAGVSVGSLYQYFPDKLGLLEAVNERYLVGMWGTVSLACREALHLPWPEALRYVVTAKINYHLSGGRLFGVLQTELPASTTIGIQLVAATNNFEVHMRKLLTANASMIAVDIDRAAHLIPIVGKGVLNAAYISHPEDLGNGRIIDDLTNVLVNYLTKPDLSELPIGSTAANPN